MARLPKPGGDDGNWGDILNTFLKVAHNNNGSLKNTGVIADKYVRPAAGIPESHLADAVQTKLNSGGVPDADAGTKGVLRLTGDLSGTSDSPTVANSAITSAKIANGTIVNADISGGAAIEQSKIADLTTDLSGKQDSDADLTAISGLSPSNDDILQRKAGAWTNRTPAQVKTDLSLTAGDVGLGNVDNTADADKPVSSATQTALDGKSDTGHTHTAANVTDFSAAVASAGAVLETDTSTADMDFVVDEDDMVSDSATMVPTQQSTKAYVDSTLSGIGDDITALEAQTVPEAGGVLMRDPDLAGWFTDLANVETEPVDIVILGDSISEFGWSLMFYKQLAALHNTDLTLTTNPVVGYKHNATSLELGGNRMTSLGGTTTATGFAGYSGSMTNGQSASNTAICDGVFVLWSEGTGTLTVRDGGAGGSVVATIDTSTGNGASNITFVDLTTYASHDVWIGSTGNTILEGVLPTVGNATKGVRVWRCAHTGYTLDTFNDNPARGLDFIEKLAAYTGRDPHVIVQAGYNQSVASYAAALTSLVGSLNTIGVGSISVWVPWIGGGGNNPAAKALAVRSSARSLGCAVVDARGSFGSVASTNDPYDLSYDGVHPNTPTVTFMAIQFLMAYTANPLGTLMLLNTLGGASFVGTLTGTLDLNLTTNGRLQISNLFGYPVLSLHAASTDAQSQVLIANSTLSNALLGINSPVIALGAGGASGMDTFITRGGVGELTIRNSGSVLGNIVTNLLRQGAGSPEGSVTAPVGATYKDTTNGIFYVKTVGTGNTGWLAAGGPAVINTQATTDYTLALADQGKTVEMNHADPNTVEVPPNTDVAFPIGTRIDIVQYGVGQTTIVGGTGVTVNSESGNLAVSARYSGATLYKRATNEWVAIGALTA